MGSDSRVCQTKTKSLLTKRDLESLFLFGKNSYLYGMVENLYKKILDEHRTTYHEVSNDAKLMRNLSEHKTNASRMGGYRNKELHYFTVSKYSENKEDFIEEYGNMLCDLENYRRTVVVEKEGDKVRLSFYYYRKIRKVGKVYFAKMYDRSYLTYNLKTDNFYMTDVVKSIGHRSRKRIRCNPTYNIGRIVEHIHDFKFTNDDSEYLKVFMRALDSDTNYGKDKFLTFEEAFIRFFVKRNGIKGPNHMTSLILRYYPGKKLFRKNGFNLVHSILDSVGLKSKYFISLMNNYKPDLSYIIQYSNLLGLKYVKTIDKDFFSKERAPYETFVDIRKKYYEDTEFYPKYQNITDYDRKNIVKVINDFTKTKPDTSLNSTRSMNITGLINDHIRIMDNLRMFEEDVKFRAKTYSEFEQEHVNYSEKYSLYRNSEEIYYQYGEKIINSLKDSQKGYEYVLLSNDMDYINESTHQNNCVRTYIDKFDSIIISVRFGDRRVTTEFTYKGDCIQKRGSYNSEVDESFNDGIIELERIMKTIYLSGDLKPPTIKIKNKLNGDEKFYTIKELKTNGYRRSRGNEGFLDFVDDELDFMLI